MPARSTEFQRLVFLVKNIVAAADATVTESKFLTNTSGEQREVDVCIEAELGGHPVILAIECYDQNRRATVEWVEQMLGKHARLPTTLVLASRSGFTKGAIKASKDAGKELLSYKALKAGDVA